MITDNIIKQKFIVDTLQKGANLAYKVQGESVGSMLQQKSGNTSKALSSPIYNIIASGNRFQVISQVTKQMRFQDLGVRKIYTKPLFSALKKTYAILRYGLSEDIKTAIVEKLQQSLNP